MDWSKAKTTLIVAFLALNLFLLFSVVLSRFDNDVSRETISNTEKILAGKGVTVKTSIPTKIITDMYISYEPYRLPMETILKELLGDGLSVLTIKTGEEYIVGDKSLIFNDETCFVYKNGKLGDTISVSSMRDAEKYAKGMLAKLGLPVKQIRLDRFVANEAKDGYHLEFKQYYDKYPLYDNRVEMEVTKNGLAYLAVKIKKPTQPKLKSRKIIPAHAILLSHFTSGGKLVITDMDLGFKGTLQSQETTYKYEYPVWRVRLENGEERFFKASDGIPVK